VFIDEDSDPSGPRGMMVLLEKQVHLQKDVGAVAATAPTRESARTKSKRILFRNVMVAVVL